MPIPKFRKLVPLLWKEFRAETTGDVASSQDCAASPGTRETQRMNTALAEAFFAAVLGAKPFAAGFGRPGGKRRCLADHIAESRAEVADRFVPRLDVDVQALLLETLQQRRQVGWDRPGLVAAYLSPGLFAIFRLGGGVWSASAVRISRPAWRRARLLATCARTPRGLSR